MHLLLLAVLFLVGPTAPGPGDSASHKVGENHRPPSPQLWGQQAKGESPAHIPNQWPLNTMRLLFKTVPWDMRTELAGTNMQVRKLLLRVPTLRGLPLPAAPRRHTTELLFNNPSSATLLILILYSHSILPQT